MKIAVAQLSPLRGSIDTNIKRHLRLIDIAVQEQIQAIFFPELSLTGYEPTLSHQLVMKLEDRRLDVFQQISDRESITVGVGAPVNNKGGVGIGLLVFQPGRVRQLYLKQLLHEDELPFFVPGDKQLVIDINLCKVAPAICYESLQPDHAANAVRMGGQVYIASVAKSLKGVEKACDYFPTVAQKYKMPVLMSNCLGPCDNFEGAGRSSVWNSSGAIIGQLDNEREGVLVFDTKNEQHTALYDLSKVD